MNILNQTISKQKDNLQTIQNKKYINRLKLPEAKKLMENDLIKVVIGPRRAGKSVLSILTLEGKHYAYLNLDEDNLLPILEEMKNYDELLHQMFAVYGQTKILFFDEIQNLKQWELFVNRLHREGYNVLLTGSNAKLLSKELSTHLTGRHYAIEILPFNFKEFLIAKNFNFNPEQLIQPEIKGQLLHFLKQYLTFGGYPELIVKNLEASNYLATLFDSVLLKDIITRYKIRFTQKINDLGNYIINNVGNQLSLRKLTNILQFKSITTLKKYLNYLEESYLIFILNRYSHKTGVRLSAPKKAYVVDNGYISAKAVQFSPNDGRLLENLVFTELIKKGLKPNLDLFYYKTRNNKEVDFITRQGINVVSLIQVSFQLDNSETQNREIKALLEASQELKCENLIILTWDFEAIKEIQKKQIKFVPLYKWLLE